MFCEGFFLLVFWRVLFVVSFGVQKGVSST